MKIIKSKIIIIINNNNNSSNPIMGHWGSTSISQSSGKIHSPLQPPYNIQTKPCGGKESFLTPAQKTIPYIFTIILQEQIFLKTIKIILARHDLQFSAYPKFN